MCGVGVMKSFDEWFKENENKFDYPRLAYKSAKMAWSQQQETLNSVLNIVDKHKYSSGEVVLLKVKELLK